MIKKTNAARFLDTLKIDYELLSYEVDDDLSAISVAKKTGIDIKYIYKTIVCEGKNALYVACIQGDLEIDLKSFAKAVGEKSLSLLKLDKLKDKTGYIRGGCSPFGMKKDYVRFIDERALELEYFVLSAGLRGLQLKINAKYIQKLFNIASISNSSII
ncbi:MULTISPECIES: YbaK/EbsC family protein [unclassified Campylobacter]|uniref:YbaK/EbsC family protein n=1 Tax=unclassified Campylobacter TaxID=2593542 RepID=UPI001BDAD794|nr:MULTISPECIES: YbaK/EbsC family protein [unclassified Campylobacter]MBZ7976199.1 Cys-tRNA(Pro) deacylase [Campylobacter sp. RM12637]MBZ7981224.1 Cys-tRNA(Pro) deacylase [Campylobacter sp. RM12640]MBZ7988950.1 Cys-tRNA(Pro) deacylase [Campylobacter sp. RM12635]MBZ7990860.1 Cys-tRNA(Pro) deacylase [Campylobacter sp. RM9331]MBZ7992596.1 Cys-tRNA(Pro) deacylase [Campylobacter sp. RM9333]MBZ8005329.1 Cys-tRNA(Pro) deacylase [Campylobacter sp. RM9332]